MQQQDKKQPSRDGSDYWGVILDNTASAFTANKPVNISLNNKAFTLYPNPAKDKISIQVVGKAVFSLISQQGKTVLTKGIDNSGSIDVSSVPAGLYYLENITTGATQKVIIGR